jgi:predicted MFS family arabinose efflux permease
MVEKIRTNHKNSQGRIFSWMALMLGFTVNLIYPIFPNFIKRIVETDEAVSIFYAVMAIFLLIGSMLSMWIFRKISRTTIMKVALALSAANFLFLIFVTRVAELYFLETIRLWMKLFLVISIALFVRDCAKETDLGEEEGLYYKFSNIGYFIGPMIGGFVASAFDYELVFSLAALTSLVALGYFYHAHIIKKHPHIKKIKQPQDFSFRKNIKEFFLDPDRRKAYLITLVLFTWFSFKRIYIPLYILTSGYLDNISGIILSLGILPFIFFEVKIGKYADKKGIRLPITTGFLIIAAILLLVFISPWPLLNFALLILASIGASFIEPLQEYYLFQHLPKDREDGMYGIYMTTDSVSYFLAPAIGAVVLAFLPFKYLFLVFAIITALSSLYFWKTLKGK